MSTQALRERIVALNVSAKHLLAEKGAATWTTDDKTKFDGIMDEAERAQTQLEAHKRLLDADAERDFKDAQRLDTTAQNPLSQGMDLFLRKHAREMSAEQSALVRNVMSTTTGSEGGNTLAPKVASELIDLLKAYGYMRKTSAQLSTESGLDISYPTSDGTSETGELVAQNTLAASSDPTFGGRALNVFKFGSRIITVPIELLQDSQIDIQAMVYTRARDRIGRAMNTFFTTGTGTAQPFGLVPACSVGKTGTTGQTVTIIYDDLVDMVDSLDAAYLDDPVTQPQMPNVAPGWMLSQTLRKTIRKIKDTAGRPIWTPSYDEGLSAASPDMLLGYPIYINNDMPAPAANAKSLAFGNLQRYLIRDAMQVQLFRFDDSAFMAKGQVGYLAWARAGGNLMDINAVKVYQHSAA